MAYTEVTRTGYFGRIGNAIKGVIFGIVLFFVSFIILFWNEGRAVHTARTLEEGKSLGPVQAMVQHLSVRKSILASAS